LEAPPALGGEPVELRLDPPPRGADPARLRHGVRQRVPRAEAHELPNVLLDPLRPRCAGDLVQSRVHARRRSRLLCPRRTAQRQQRDNHGRNAFRRHPAPPSSISGSMGAPRNATRRCAYRSPPASAASAATTSALPLPSTCASSQAIHRAHMSRSVSSARWPWSSYGYQYSAAVFPSTSSAWNARHELSGNVPTF